MIFYRIQRKKNKRALHYKVCPYTPANVGRPKTVCMFSMTIGMQVTKHSIVLLVGLEQMLTVSSHHFICGLHMGHANQQFIIIRIFLKSMSHSFVSVVRFELKSIFFFRISCWLLYQMTD